MRLSIGLTTELMGSPTTLSETVHAPQVCGSVMTRTLGESPSAVLAEPQCRGWPPCYSCEETLQQGAHGAAVLDVTNKKECANYSGTTVMSAGNNNRES
jgi:hypothetical protein